MTGALVVAQPNWFPAAREAWPHHGVRCAIVASPLGGWNGYVLLPWGHPWRACAWMETPLGAELSWGPDDQGWVGFDTGHGGDAWHPDDDTPPYQPGWWPGPPPPPDVLAGMAARVAELRRLTAAMSGRELWTLPRLRAKVEDLAKLVALAGQPPPWLPPVLAALLDPDQ